MLTCALEVAELLSAASLSSIPEETVGFTFWEAIITLWNDRIVGLFYEKTLSVPLKVLQEYHNSDWLITWRIISKITHI